ncbi:hypothetical protein PsorP6_003951 [Peronosclerospora sorghi]|uniref:Uncharacterized protein n=1 Tax=Peronosclerospora sorghi TaxID=230839 RepID=A0ACC0VMP5_9STRA|nr:hypothetical protein PsorP6_003951 [Peronosclerospora sorghi]
MKDKRKAPPSMQNASMQSHPNFATALKEAAQEKALAIQEADDKRIQWEKEKWEDEKSEREREKEEREATWAEESEDREQRWVVEREERVRKLELEERELELRKKDAEKEIRGSVAVAAKAHQTHSSLVRHINLRIPNIVVENRMWFQQGDKISESILGRPHVLLEHGFWL